jgi:copper homeostasis protein
LTHTLLEACVERPDEAVAAEQGGAGRIELCANLAEQGTTPSEGTLAACLARLSIPVFPIVRPRAGGFSYDAHEVEAMLRQAHRALRLGAHGVVAGALKPDGTIDRDVVVALRRAVDPAPLTFHRAFDATRDRAEALDDLIALGVARVLTSGGAPTAHEGVPEIARLVQQAAGRIIVMAGGGVRAPNVREIVSRAGVREVHARLRSREAVRRVVEALRSPSPRVP